MRTISRNPALAIGLSDRGELAAGLRERTIIVRHFKQARIDQFLRISIGTDAESAALSSALQELLTK